MANPRNAAEGRRQMLESVYSMIALVFILVAYVELCHASTVVDVYRLIQYISGVPFGSRVASLNHHAGSSLFAPGSDLSRTVVILPLRELNETFIREYIEQGKPLGGILLLLPRIFHPENSETGHGDSSDKENMKKLLVDLEQKLIHSSIHYPVYFAFEDEDLDTVLADIKKNDAAGQPATATTGGWKQITISLLPGVRGTEWTASVDKNSFLHDRAVSQMPHDPNSRCRAFFCQEHVRLLRMVKVKVSMP